MTRIEVRVQPRSSQNRLEELPDGTWKAWLTAPPTDGQANAALRELVAKHFGVAKSRVSIIRGETSRNKVLEVD